LNRPGSGNAARIAGRQRSEVRGIRDLFFSKGERAAYNLPGSLTSEFVADKRPGRLQWRLSFDLPRGAYATLLIKAATQGHSGSEETPSAQGDRHARRS